MLSQALVSSIPSSIHTLLKFFAATIHILSWLACHHLVLAFSLIVMHVHLELNKSKKFLLNLMLHYQKISASNFDNDRCKQIWKWIIREFIIAYFQKLKKQGVFFIEIKGGRGVWFVNSPVLSDPTWLKHNLSLPMKLTQQKFSVHISESECYSFQ